MKQFVWITRGKWMHIFATSMSANAQMLQPDVVQVSSSCEHLGLPCDLSHAATNMFYYSLINKFDISLVSFGKTKQSYDY